MTTKNQDLYASEKYETQLAPSIDKASVESPDQNRPSYSSYHEERLTAKELKDSVSFSKLLERDGKKLIPTEHSFKCACPFHKDSQETFYIWSNESGGRCYDCEWKGDIYAYIMKKHKLEFSEAFEKLQGLAKHIQRDEADVKGGVA